MNKMRIYKSMFVTSSEAEEFASMARKKMEFLKTWESNKENFFQIPDIWIPEEFKLIFEVDTPDKENIAFNVWNTLDGITIYEKTYVHVDIDGRIHTTVTTETVGMVNAAASAAVDYIMMLKQWYRDNLHNPAQGFLESCTSSYVRVPYDGEPKNAVVHVKGNLNVYMCLYKEGHFLIPRALLMESDAINNLDFFVTREAA